MGDSLSPAARALLEAAKSDAPRAVARTQMWGAVSTATGVAAGVVKGTTAVGITAAASSGKLLVVGALLGSLLTAGVGYGVVRAVAGQREGAGASSSQTRVHEDGHVGGHDPVVTVSEADRAPRRDGRDELSSNPMPAIPIRLDPHDRVANSGSPAPMSTSIAAPTTSPNGVRMGAEDALNRAAALILEARGALRRGDAEGALVSLEAARKLGQLEPEALALRVRALRSLGRDDEADAIEAMLRTKYPDHSLSR